MRLVNGCEYYMDSEDLEQDDIRQWQVPTGADGVIRLDRFLTDQVVGQRASRSYIQRLIGEGKVVVNGKVASKSGMQLMGGELVQLLGDLEVGPIRLQPAEMPLNIIYEDEFIWVIDKAPGVTVHPGAGTIEPTLVAALLGRHAENPPPIFSCGGVRPGIVHRLDKDTSGLLVVAKTREAYSGLVGQFANRQVKRRYLALVQSTPRRKQGIGVEMEGIIDAPIGRHPQHRVKMAVLVSGGRPAITRWRVLARGDWAILCEVELETGRTHQIRVHFAHIGSPIIGDTVYGSVALLPQALRPAAITLRRQALHAFSLVFQHPVSGEALHFSSELPSDLQLIIKRCIPDVLLPLASISKPQTLEGTSDG